MQLQTTGLLKKEVSPKRKHDPNLRRPIRGLRGEAEGVVVENLLGSRLGGLNRNCHAERKKPGPVDHVEPPLAPFAAEQLNLMVCDMERPSSFTKPRNRALA